MPDANGGSLDRALPAEGAGVGCVLGDLHFLDLFSERGAVACAILADDADLAGAFSHCGWVLLVTCQVGEGWVNGDEDLGG